MPPGAKSWGLKMTERPMTDSALDALFAAAREERPEPSPALMARVMEDALAEGAARQARATVPRAATRPGPRAAIAAIVAALGGWPAMGGFATAGIVGLWIGYAAPGAVATYTSNWLGGGYDIADLMPSLDAYLTEG